MIVAYMSWQLVLRVPCLFAEGSCNSLQQPTLKNVETYLGRSGKNDVGGKAHDNLSGHLMGLDMRRGHL